uniref:Uncharacterized protein n=1 Tax=Arundo donax TaxID=35708 RepID=A0A0A9AE76_ARUDO
MYWYETQFLIKALEVLLIKL